MNATRTIEAARAAGASLELRDGELFLIGASLLSETALEQIKHQKAEIILALSGRTRLPRGMRVRGVIIEDRDGGLLVLSADKLCDDDVEALHNMEMSIAATLRTAWRKAPS
jgi:hypothetical protein